MNTTVAHGLPVVKSNMADLKGHLREKVDTSVIRDRVRILYLLFLWFWGNYI